MGRGAVSGTYVFPLKIFLASLAWLGYEDKYLLCVRTYINPSFVPIFPSHMIIGRFRSLQLVVYLASQ